MYVMVLMLRANDFFLLLKWSENFTKASNLCINISLSSCVLMSVRSNYAKPKLNLTTFKTYMITFFSIKTDLCVLIIIIIFCVKQG